MGEELKKYLDEFELILKEIERHDSFKKTLFSDLNNLNKRYESGKLGYQEYAKIKDRLLEGKTKDEQMEYFSTYILSLIRKLEFLNTQMFSLIFEDKAFLSVRRETQKPQKTGRSYYLPKEAPLPAEVSKPKNPVIKEPMQEMTLAKTQPVGEKKDLKPMAAAPFSKEILAAKEEKAPRPQVKKLQEIRVTASIPVFEKNAIEKPKIQADFSQKKEKPKALPLPVKKEKEQEKTKAIPATTEPEEIAAEILPKEKEKNPVKEAEKDFFQQKAVELGEVQDLSYQAFDIPKPFPKKQHLVPHPKKKGIFSKKGFEIGESQKSRVKFRGILSLGFIREIFSRIRDKEEVISKDTIKSKSILDFHELSKIDFEEEAKSNPNILVRQATQLKEILKKRKVPMYTSSAIGAVANISVRRLSIILIDSFPNFFKKFYLTLRYANIKILSNTYVNIMVFLSILTALVFGFFASIFSVISGDPLFLIVSKFFLMASTGASLCIGFMIYYPYMRIKKRMKSINTNLPFAIDHMSAIVASGVPPSAMFRLLADSKDYGEVSLEIEKIANFIDFFGYDLLTAIKSVSATTPSSQLKEFFDGLVSTIESGGSLKNYLAQKSQESMLSYKVERQKYVETITTYSDIYTGLLIAAPLFFVSALSLVSILGGKIGGFNVETLIAFGTYVVIPLLNVFFIIFLEMNQPEI